MQQFNTKFFEFKKLYETPEVFYDDVLDKEHTMQSPDVVTFVYQINENAIAFSETGLFISHADIMKSTKKQSFINKVKYLGEFDIQNLSVDNIITGRLWINHDKISFWDYTNNLLQNDDIVKKYLLKMSKYLNIYLNINVQNYEIEITSVFDNFDKKFSYTPKIESHE